MSPLTLVHNESYTYPYLRCGQILVCCVKSIFNMFLIEFWRLETRSSPYYDLSKLQYSDIWPSLIVDTFHFIFNFPLFTYSKKWRRTCNLAPVFQIVQKTPENYRPCLYYHLTKVGDLMSCSSKYILNKASYLIY